jgi:hypothetical protein
MNSVLVCFFRSPRFISFTWPESIGIFKIEFTKWPPTGLYFEYTRIKFPST